MKFLMITKNPEIGKYIIDHGVDRVFIDLEKLGKNARQGHLNSWKSDHLADDILKMREFVTGEKILVRLNPWNENSNKEINNAIEYGADFLMLPMIKSLNDLKKFSYEVSNRVPIIPLIETKESIDFLDKIILLDGINEVYIGLNDLSLSYGYKFMFEPLINGLLDDVANLLNTKGISWGFGGIAKKGDGKLPAENILGEHVRLGSRIVILSRSFHQAPKDLKELLNKSNFENEIKILKNIYQAWLKADSEALHENHLIVKKIINQF